jgi:hypothetical protein
LKTEIYAPMFHHVIQNSWGMKTIKFLPTEERMKKCLYKYISIYRLEYYSATLYYNMDEPIGHYDMEISQSWKDVPCIILLT